MVVRLALSRAVPLSVLRTQVIFGRTLTTGSYSRALSMKLDDDNSDKKLDDDNSDKKLDDGNSDKGQEVIFRSYIPDIPLPEQDSTTLIIDRATRWADKVAIECGETGRKYTYGGLVDRSLRWGAALRKVLTMSTPGSCVVAICMGNCPEYPVISLGTQAVGATVSTVSAVYTRDEMTRQLVDCGASVAVVDPHLEAVFMAAVGELHHTHKIKVFVNGVSAFGSPNVRQILEDTRAPFAEPVQNSLSSIATLLYSSGTTGLPKGVAMSHGAYSSNLPIFTDEHHFTYYPTSESVQDSIIGLLPFYHVYGMYVVILTGLYLGVKIISLPKFSPETFLATMRNHKIGPLHLVPPILNFLATSPQVTSGDLIHVRTAMIAGAAVSPALARAFKEKSPNPDMFFQEGFGMTETLGTHMTPRTGEEIGYCGKLVSNTLAKLIHPETGKSVGKNQQGEMWVKSPSLMSHYHNNPDETAANMDSEGWLCTGDIAVCNDEEYFTIVDRSKELIKVKGFQVSPTELEELLLHHPRVTDVGVVGVEDDRAGELPRAYVVKNGTLTEQDLHDFIQEKVAPYKRLTGGIIFVDKLPKNQTGKLLRRQLQQIAKQEA